MNEQKQVPVEVNAEEASNDGFSGNPTAASSASPRQRRLLAGAVKLLIPPTLFLVSGAILLAGLGVAQKMGFLSDGGATRQQATGGAQRYICPMMCTPPQSEPGRCPVCAMELVPASAGGGGNSRSITIDAASRRISNIQTAAVRRKPVTRTIRAIGELQYDEGSLKTLSAYVDGRLEKLYADYTGVAVEKGDHLALVYSPQLYTGQVELLLAKKSFESSRNSSIESIRKSNKMLYEKSRERLMELGMLESQIQEIERLDKADSRMHLRAPMSGTVIEKLAVEGQYVKESQAIYKLADLSTVWLMLRLFPEDAAAITYGQKVDASVQSLPGEIFSGRVAFIDRHVDAKTRTVGVRVVISNADGRLRVGDYAKASIAAPVSGRRALIASDAASGNPTDVVGSGIPSGAPRPFKVFDPELANKWISPRHPHIVASEPGQCPLCDMDLVPAADFGFTSEPIPNEAIVVPRDAVLMAGDHSVVYVETSPGKFEIRNVVLGPNSGDDIVVWEGLKDGEQVATRGNFLIDSQMQLAGNPSLIDPTKAITMVADADTKKQQKIEEALAGLAPADRELAMKQGTCPVADFALGSMGTPKKVDVNGTPVFICCDACRERLLNEPEAYLAKVAAGPSQNDAPPRPEFEPPMLIEPDGVPEISQPPSSVPPHDSNLPPIGPIQEIPSEPLEDSNAPASSEVPR